MLLPLQYRTANPTGSSRFRSHRAQKTKLPATSVKQAVDFQRCRDLMATTYCARSKDGPRWSQCCC